MPRTVKKFLLIISFSTFFFSCFLSDDTLFLRNGIGDSKTFWAQDFSKSAPEEPGFYTLKARLLAHTSLCKVWVEYGSAANEKTARAMAEAYHNEIYPRMINTFGANFSVNGKTLNTMQFADEMSDRDGKLCILLLDIKDGYKNNNDSYVAGYFWAGNLYDRRNYEHSNVCDMIYIDTNPGVPGSREAKATLAHEMQHLMNFVSSYMNRSEVISDREININFMDTWIDEGLSCAAEWLYLGEHSEGRWRWYNEDQSGLISEGNNFFVWGNHEDVPLAILDDYSTDYLFFQWLRLQAGSEHIYNDIISSEYYDYRAVTEAAKDYHINSSSSGNDWDGLLRDWLAANYINAASGRYGYKNDPTLRNISAPWATEGGKSIQLAAGEGVYSYISSSSAVLPGQGIFIRYAGLSRNSADVSVTGSAPIGGALLTYNINPNNAKSGSLEPGIITGEVPAIVLKDSVSASRSKNAPLKGPFPISASDMQAANQGKRP